MKLCAELYTGLGDLIASHTGDAHEVLEWIRQKIEARPKTDYVKVQEA